MQARIVRVQDPRSHLKLLLVRNVLLINTLDLQSTLHAQIMVKKMQFCMVDVLYFVT